MAQVGTFRGVIAPMFPDLRNRLNQILSGPANLGETHGKLSELFWPARTLCKNRNQAILLSAVIPNLYFGKAVGIIDASSAAFDGEWSKKSSEVGVDVHPCPELLSAMAVLGYISERSDDVEAGVWSCARELYLAMRGRISMHMLDLQSDWWFKRKEESGDVLQEPKADFEPFCKSCGKSIRGRKRSYVIPVDGRPSKWFCDDDVCIDAASQWRPESGDCAS